MLLIRWQGLWWWAAPDLGCSAVFRGKWGFRPFNPGSITVLSVSLPGFSKLCFEAQWKATCWPPVPKAGRAVCQGSSLQCAKVANHRMGSFPLIPMGHHSRHNMGSYVTGLLQVPSDITRSYHYTPNAVEGQAKHHGNKAHIPARGVSWECLEISTSYL